MNAIIIDDDPNVTATLQSLLKAYCPEVNLLATASSVIQARQVLNSHPTDLIFLDIELGDDSGLDLIREWENPPFQVIFITAHEQYAIAALRLSALDFLLKPIDQIELQEAVRKAKDGKQRITQEMKLSSLLNNMQSLSKQAQKLVIKDSESIHIVTINDLIHCRAQGSYTELFLKEGRQMLSSRNLKYYEELLTEYDFYRPHHSHLVNLQHVIRFERKDGGWLLLHDQLSVPVAQRKRDALLRRLDSLHLQ